MTFQATNDVAQKRAAQSSRLLVVCVVLSVLVHLLLFFVSSRFFDDAVESNDFNSNANSITITLMPPGPPPTIEAGKPPGSLTPEPVVDAPSEMPQSISEVALITNKEVDRPIAPVKPEPVVDAPDKMRQSVSEAALIINKEVDRKIDPVNNNVPSHPQISAVALINRSWAFIRDDESISESGHAHERGLLVFSALLSENKGAGQSDAIEAYRMAGDDMKIKIRSPLGGYHCFEAPASPSSYALQEDIWRISRC